MNKLSKMAKELLFIDEDLSARLIEEARSPDSMFIDRVEDFDFYVFEQVWSRTPIGFGEIGSQKITSANTYVFVPNAANTDLCFVYFGSTFAYKVPYSEAIMDDIKHQSMEPVSRAEKYIKDAKEESNEDN